MSHARYETLLYEKSGAIATLTLNRPDRMNGMTNRMVAESVDAGFAAVIDRLVERVLSGALHGPNLCRYSIDDKNAFTISALM